MVVNLRVIKDFIEKTIYEKMIGTQVTYILSQLLLILELDSSMASSMYLNSVWCCSISCIFSAFSLFPISLYSFSLSYYLASFSSLFWDLIC